MIYLFTSQSHEDLEAMSLMQLRKMCEEKGVKPTSWDRNKLLKLIAGEIVMNTTNPYDLHSCFGTHFDITSSSNNCIVLGVASSSELPLSEVTSSDAQGGHDLKGDHTFFESDVIRVVETHRGEMEVKFHVGVCLCHYNSFCPCLCLSLSRSLYFCLYCFCLGIRLCLFLFGIVSACRSLCSS